MRLAAAGCCNLGARCWSASRGAPAGLQPGSCTLSCATAVRTAVGSCAPGLNVLPHPGPPHHCPALPRPAYRQMPLSDAAAVCRLVVPGAAPLLSLSQDEGLLAACEDSLVRIYSTQRLVEGGDSSPLASFQLKSPVKQVRH